MGDSSIYERSCLKQFMDSTNLLEEHVPPTINNVGVHPYILGDWAFPLSMHLIKTCTRDEAAASLYLKE